jgi:hypothetical protein
MGKLARWHWLWCAWPLWADSDTKMGLREGKVQIEHSGVSLESAFPTYEKCIAADEAEARSTFPSIQSEAIGPGNENHWVRRDVLKNGNVATTLHRCFPDSVSART